MVPHLGPGCREEQPWIRSSGGEHPTAKDPVREGPAGPECQLFDDWSGIEAAGRRKYGMTIGASWSRPRVKKARPVRQSGLGIPTARDMATAAPWP